MERDKLQRYQLLYPTARIPFGTNMYQEIEEIFVQAGLDQSSVDPPLQPAEHGRNATTPADEELLERFEHSSVGARYQNGEMARVLLPVIPWHMSWEKLVQFWEYYRKLEQVFCAPEEEETRLHRFIIVLQNECARRGFRCLFPEVHGYGGETIKLPQAHVGFVIRINYDGPVEPVAKALTTFLLTEINPFDD